MTTKNLFYKKKPAVIYKKHIPKNNIKKTKKTKKLSHCAPFIVPSKLSRSSKLTTHNINIIESATDETCFSIESLRKIADKWNESNPTMRIEYTETTKGRTLWNSINNAMNTECNSEVCWLKQPFLKNSPLIKQLKHHFKPIMPEKWNTNPREWLNTLNIRDVMVQYETKHPEFEFIGPVPIDFDAKLGFGQCVVEELCKIDIGKIMEMGKTKLGIVFNLDKHNQSGSHWVALYGQLPAGDKQTGELYYWDSYGIRPEREIVDLMKKLQKQSKDMGRNMSIKMNNIRHQYKNSECGVYCIYFLTSLLEGKTFREIVTNIINDDKMNAKRGEFFIRDE